MHSNTLRALVLSLITAAAATGCGKGSVPAEDTSAKKADDEAKVADEGKSNDKKKDDASPADDSKSKKKDDAFSIERKAKDYLTAPDVVFMYSFKESDPGIKAEKACEDKSKGDNEKKASCIKAAQKRVSVDGYHFAQNDSGTWYWEVVQVKSGVINYLHKVPIEFGKEADKTIEIKVVGKDEAKAAAGKLPSEVTFETPNAYQIVQEDSDKGKLVFEAKLGLLGDPATRKKK